MKTIIFIALIAINLPAMALYKCATPGGGTAFQDVPCAGKSETVNVQGSNKQAMDSTSSSGNGTCEKALFSTQKFNDPYSVQIVSITKSGTDAIPYANTSVVATKYVVIANAKNTNGAYEGEKSYICYTSPDGLRLLQFNSSPNSRNRLHTNQQSADVSATTKSSRCPTAQEIRDMETSASSIRLSDNERQLRLKQIGEARLCGTKQ
ncbi:MAG TPA: hypothetical protein PKC80_07800 [Burkholderiaceae bacterium]|nr:hypothetical protein [Burkholderiaceae bacterium]